MKLFGGKHLFTALALVTLSNLAFSGCFMSSDYCTKTGTHVYEKLASGSTKTYLGFAIKSGKYRLAYCEVDKNGNQNLRILHRATASGGKGTEISVNVDGTLQENISICGDANANTVLGGLAFVDKYGYDCEGSYFWRIATTKDYELTISTLGGNDKVLGVSVADTYNDGEKLFVCTGSGNDIVDMRNETFSDGGYSHEPYSITTMLLGKGDDQGYTDTNLWDSRDRCSGHEGNDWLVCDYCRGSSGTDACSCGDEKDCEEDFYY